MGNFISIDARSSRELQAVLLSMKLATKEIDKNIRTQSKRVIVPEWQKGLDQRAVTPAERKILAGTGRASVSDSNVKLQSGGLKRTLSGGLSTENNRAIEFGANRTVRQTYRTHSRKGKAYSITRRTRMQLKWQSAKGFVVYPTASNLIPRIASLWIQTVVRSMHEAFEGK